MTPLSFLAFWMQVLLQSLQLHGASIWLLHAGGAYFAPRQHSKYLGDNAHTIL